MPVPFDVTEAVAALVEPDADPQLLNSEIDAAILRTADYAVWQPNTTYTIGSVVGPTMPNGWTYRVVSSGTVADVWYDEGFQSSGAGGVSGATEPVWNVPWSYRNEYARVVDNTLVWLAHLPAMGGPYNMRRAAAELWRVKARKAANRVDIGMSGVASSRDSQLRQACLDEARRIEPVAFF